MIVPPSLVTLQAALEAAVQVPPSTANSMVVKSHDLFKKAAKVAVVKEIEEPDDAIVPISMYCSAFGEVHVASDNESESSTRDLWEY
jgi:hypothetical protein